MERLPRFGALIGALLGAVVGLAVGLVWGAAGVTGNGVRDATICVVLFALAGGITVFLVG